MIADVLRKITYGGMTNVHEIARLTGRGESTIYRWINGDSQPDFSSIQKLASDLSNLSARQRLLDLFTQSMPVTTHWSENNASDPEATSPRGVQARRQTVCQCVASIGQVADAMRLLACSREAASSTDDILEAGHLINQAINGLMEGRQMLEQINQPPAEAGEASPESVRVSA